MTLTYTEEGAQAASLPGVFALLRISGHHAVVVVSNDGALQGRRIPWPGRADAIAPGALQALQLSVGTHRTLESAGTRWMLICGARGDGKIALPHMLDEWGLDLVRRLLARDRSADPFVLRLQPIFEITSGRATRAEAFLRSEPDVAARAAADRWVLSTVLERAAEWNHEYGIRAVHVNVTVQSRTDAEPVLEILRSASPSARAAVAVEIVGARDFSSPDFLATIDAFAQAGTACGVDLPECSLSQLLELMAVPVNFVKIPARDAAPLAEGYPWNVFITQLETKPAWEELRHGGAQYVQGFALQPPIELEDFKQWLQMSSASSSLAQRT